MSKKYGKWKKQKNIKCEKIKDEENQYTEIFKIIAKNT